jgi:hypothetical protein
MKIIILQRQVGASARTAIFDTKVFNDNVSVEQAADISSQLMIAETQRIADFMPELIDITVLSAKLIEIPDSELMSFLQQDKINNLDDYLKSLNPESIIPTPAKPVFTIVPKDKKGN